MTIDSREHPTTPEAIELILGLDTSDEVAWEAACAELEAAASVKGLDFDPDNYDPVALVNALKA